MEFRPDAGDGGSWLNFEHNTYINISTMSDDQGLTEYERVRLANIKRNQEFLAGLGLDLVKPRQQNDREKFKASRRAKEERRRREREGPIEGSRRSARLRNTPAPSLHEVDSEDEVVSTSSASKAKKEKKRKREREMRGKKETKDGDDEEEEEDLFVVDYTRLPQAYDEIDDHEFLVFNILRKWRKTVSDELEIEPYKVFQNRTLCEWIRRRRNEPSFATEEDFDELSDVLTEVWGIGPAKVMEPTDDRPDGGYAHQMMKVVEEHREEIERLLQTSRKLGGIPVPEADEGAVTVHVQV